MFVVSWDDVQTHYDHIVIPIVMFAYKRFLFHVKISKKLAKCPTCRVDLWVFYPAKIQKQTQSSHSNASQCDTLGYYSVIFQEEKGKAQKSLLQNV